MDEIIKVKIIGNIVHMVGVITGTVTLTTINQVTIQSDERDGKTIWYLFATTEVRPIEIDKDVVADFILGWNHKTNDIMLQDSTFNLLKTLKEK